MIYKELQQVFQEYFNGENNLVTPQVYGYEVVQINNDNIILFEKSTNDKGTIYGVTSLLYNPRTHEVTRIDLNESFENSRDVNKYINNISYEDFTKADQYGLTKKIKLK